MDCSLISIAGGIIQGEVLVILIENQNTGGPSNVPLKKFRKIMINKKMGVPIDDYFIRECWPDLKKEDW